MSLIRQNLVLNLEDKEKIAKPKNKIFLIFFFGIYKF